MTHKLQAVDLNISQIKEYDERKRELDRELLRLLEEMGPNERMLAIELFGGPATEPAAISTNGTGRPDHAKASRMHKREEHAGAERQLMELIPNIVATSPMDGRKIRSFFPKRLQDVHGSVFHRAMKNLQMAHIIHKVTQGKVPTYVKSAAASTRPIGKSNAKKNAKPFQDYLRDAMKNITAEPGVSTKYVFDKVIGFGYRFSSTNTTSPMTLVSQGLASLEEKGELRKIGEGIGRTYISVK